MSALATGVTMPTAMSLAARAEAAQPRAGGHLRIAVARPEEARRLAELALGDTLAEVTADGRVAPGLARRITPSEGGRRWTLDLAEARFSDGQAVTSADVEEGLGRASAGLPHLRAVEIDGPDRVQLVLAQPDYDLPWRLADPLLAILRTDEGAPIGTGAYALVEATEEAITLARKDDDWKKGRAFVETVRIDIVPDARRRLTAVMSGEIDYAATLPPEAVAFLGNLDNVALVRTPFAASHILSAGNADLPDAREAITRLRAGLDRKLLVDSIELGHGQTGDDCLPLAPCLSPTRMPEPSGTESGGTLPQLRLKLALTSGADEKAAREIIVAAGKLGIDLTPDPSAAGHALRLDTMTRSALDGLAADPEALVAAFSAGATPRPEIAAQLREAAAIEDETGRAALQREAARALAEAAPLILPVWTSDLSAHARGLTHGALSGHRPHDGYRLIDRWWFA